MVDVSLCKSHHEITSMISSELRDANERCWVFGNFITSVDGGFEINGASGGLGTPADRIAFSTLRAQSDVILVGAETVRVEKYRRPLAPTGELAELRIRRGQLPCPRLAIVTSDPESMPHDTLAAHPERDPHPPLLYVSQRPGAGAVESEDARRYKLATQLSGRWSFEAILDDLHERGMKRVLCEGGPSILGALLSAGLLDELNLTISPVILGAQSGPPFGQHATPLPLSLDRVLVHGSTMLSRYLMDTR